MLKTKSKGNGNQTKKSLYLINQEREQANCKHACDKDGKDTSKYITRMEAINKGIKATKSKIK